MESMKNENVLFVPRPELARVMDLSKTFWRVTAAELSQLPFDFAPRAELETDGSRKQLIPYALLLDERKRVLTYRRHGSEKRLADKWSAGIGGHVNDGDKRPALLNTLTAGLSREIKEETGLCVSAPQMLLLGMINEEISEVGHSHTGVVFAINVQNAAFVYDAEIAEPHFWNMDNVDLSLFETWSSLALDLYKERG
jgi:predicted NUDIX family phosphoesterase